MNERQEQIMRVIRAHITERGETPTLREIAQAVGLSSPSTVLHHLRALERQGIVQRNARRWRRYQPAA